jgi:multidrug/hemolysin transport system permease protein
MRSSIALTSRNIKLFWRDRTTVFFSFLSTLILVALYFLFIAKMYKDGMTVSNGFSFDESAKDFIVYLQMMAGVLVLNSMSLSMGAFSIIAKDFETRKLDGFLLTPIKIPYLMISYYISSFIVSFTLNLFTWILSAVLIGALTGYWVAAATFFAGVAVLAVASLISSSMMLLLTVIVKSSSAIGVISGIAGTFLGFLCGIYMPYSFLGNGAKTVGSFIPYTHLTIWLKQFVLTDAFNQLNIAKQMQTVLMDEYFSGGSIGFCGIDAPLWVMLIFCAVFALACLLIARQILKKRIAG